MSEADQSRFSDVEHTELSEYKPLSALAVFALLASLLGVIAAFQPWLVAIPALASVLGIVAVAVLSRRDTKTGGKWLATSGLLLSLFLVGFASARNYSRRQHLCDLARPHAETWLRLILDGRVREAHQLTLEEPLRDTGNLDQVYSVGGQEAAAAMMKLQTADGRAPGMEALAGAPKPRRDELKRFVEMPYVRKLVDLSPEATLTFVSHDLILDSTLKTTIAETFSVADSSGEPFDVTMVLERSEYGDHAGWHVSMQ